MALIACPDCGRDVSDQARTCQYCGLPVSAHLRQLREDAEEERALLEEEAEARRLADTKQKTQTVLIIIGIIAFVFIGGSISASQQGNRVVLQLANQLVNVKPTGGNAFSAHGTIKIDFSCQAGTKGTSSVQFILVDVNSTATIWKKSLTCSGSGSQSLQVASSDYDIGATVSGGATWTMTITQT